MSKVYFLTRQRAFVECEIIKQNNHHRTIKILEGKDANRTVTIAPDGVAKGWLYPRIFTCTEKPTDFFEFKNRVALKRKAGDNLIPKVDKGYAFQPYLKDVIDSVNARENVLLTGATGTGKTSCVVQLAAQINQALVRVNFNGETRLSDFIGKMHIKDSNTHWVDGVLPLAMRKGLWLVLDEIDFADPAILSLLHPVLEEDSILVLKENNGEVIRPHPYFRIFGTANSIGAMADRAASYSGTQTMNDAFLDRWQVIKVPNLPFKDELRVVRAKTSGLRFQWAKKIVEFAQKVRSSQDGGINFATDNFSTRRVLTWAKKTALAGCPIEGAKIAWLDKLPASEQEAVLRTLQLHFGRTGKKGHKPEVTDSEIQVKKKK